MAEAMRPRRQLSSSSNEAVVTAERETPIVGGDEVLTEETLEAEEEEEGALFCTFGGAGAPGQEGPGGVVGSFGMRPVITEFAEAAVEAPVEALS